LQGVELVVIASHGFHDAARWLWNIRASHCGDGDRKAYSINNWNRVITTSSADLWWQGRPLRNDSNSRQWKQIQRRPS
jgi:hypothetical protein